MEQVHLTKTELALRILRERIQDGTMQPGERIQPESLQQEFGMSPTPIREALRLLQADGLVDYQPHRLMQVAETPDEVIGEVYRLREQLEPWAVELAVPRVDEGALAAIEAIHEQFIAAASNQDAAQVAKLNYAWHFAIYESAGSPLLLEFIGRLWKSAPWRTNSAVAGWGEAAPRQHEEIMSALREGDAMAAAALMRGHIDTGRELGMRSDRSSLPT